MEYYSAIKKNEIMAFAAKWMDPEIVILNEVSQIEKEKYCIIVITRRNKSDRESKMSYNNTYMWNLKRNDTNELIYKTETDSPT